MNLYWPIYRNLEKELIALSNQIHFDDKQLGIYSVKISELLIRCSVEIESIAKDLYFENDGETPEGSDLYFDTDCLELLENLWSLSKKQVIVTAQNIYFVKSENQILTPLSKANRRGTSGSDWKKAYQAVKHNRILNLSKGNLRNLMRAMGALYLLNIYYKNDRFELGDDGAGITFDARLGSEIFSVKLHVNTSIAVDGTYKKSTDFPEYTYFLTATDETARAARESMRIMQEKANELANKHYLSVIEEQIKKPIGWTAGNAQSKLEEIINKEKDKIGSRFLMQAARNESSTFKNLQFEAIVNKDQV